MVVCIISSTVCDCFIIFCKLAEHKLLLELNGHIMLPLNYCVLFHYHEISRVGEIYYVQWNGLAGWCIN